MATRILAKELGLVDVIKVEKYATRPNSKQQFDFLFVLDFEATCWEASDKNKCPSEIIEFPVVLYDVKNSEIVAEFQQYVMPTEVPRLSAFCVALTGITQEKVDDGVPIQTCLMLFMKWFEEQTQIYNIELSPFTKRNKGSFVTWSNWDLGKCLKNECRRKGIIKPMIFSNYGWIDLRALYKEHYGRIPKGLKGALSEVGLDFQGREHCGLHDARNTAFLARKMIADGMILRIMNK